ncbi:MAG: flavin reductase family protein [Candidatus Latescibacteria bacterium]|jgi:flavin reductase (DIM6/NTAB) family NADH-FMN oxidoreductase RutF|nr:flavin reductase family protein [Candidatus Latescibacterota bacterium]
MAKFYTEHDRRLPKTPDEPFSSPGYLPVSAIMISVADPETGIPNIMPAVGWGWLNRDPMLLGVAVNTKDYNNDYFPRGTHPILKRTMDFALNLPTEDLRDSVTRCGELSRHKDPAVDKFKEAGLTPGPGRRIKSPHIVECPINYECVVYGIYNMGSHDLFVGEVVGCFTDGEVVEVQTLQGRDNISMKLEDGSIQTIEWTTLLRKVEK